MNNRQKGLGWVREVRKILEGMGHIVEGPGYGVAFYQGSMKPVHRDYFGCFDLISFDTEKHEMIGHQVSDLPHKAAKVKAIQKAELAGWVWCRLDNRLEYRVFIVGTGYCEEAQVRFVAKHT